jgi:hypothetical protein
MKSRSHQMRLLHSPSQLALPDDGLELVVFGTTVLQVESEYSVSVQLVPPELQVVCVEADARSGGWAHEGAAHEEKKQPEKLSTLPREQPTACGAVPSVVGHHCEQRAAHVCCLRTM